MKGGRAGAERCRNRIRRQRVMGFADKREGLARAGHLPKPRIKEVPPCTDPTWPRFLAGLFFGARAI